MLQAGETFFTSIGCMDGRVQEAVAQFGQRYFHAQYPDTITEAGLVGILAKGDVDQNLLDSIKKKINISLDKHHSKGIVVCGHQDCAGNPVEDEKQKKDILKSAEIIRSFIPEGPPVVPLFVKRKQDRWIVECLF